MRNKKNDIFIKYCLISLFCTIILYLLFYIINESTNGNYVLANVVAYTTSFTLLFILDQKLFKSKKNKFNQLINFIIARLFGLVLDTMLLTILIEKFNIPNIYAKIFGSLIMFTYNYLTNKLFVFPGEKV